MNFKNWKYGLHRLSQEEISGFLSIFRFNKGKVYVLPNPFAKEERENRNYEWLGLLAKSL